MRLPARVLTIATMAVALLGARPGAGQRVVLTVSGGPLTFPGPTAADYVAGSVTDGTPLQYNVNIQNGAANTLRTTTVEIRATGATFGTLPLADLQWRRSDLATWNSLTTSNVTIESRQISRNTGNNWTNSVVFRCLLTWTGAPPATYSTNLVFTMTVTTP